MSTSSPATHPGKRARVVRVWLSITDDHGATLHYSCIPAGLNRPDLLRVYRLTRYAADRSVAAQYLASIDDNGHMECTCPGHQAHHHCKHVDALGAAGLLDADLLLAIHKLQLENETYQATLLADLAQLRQRLAALPLPRRKVPSPRAPRKPAQPRRPRQPVAA